ncbi:MAG: HlyD family efflux transporter periplasmic adaptor subunit [Verrucomicrobiae bacterium]|nr:HlyD family efflux transporter periplasmic adaptor subunit [Verrucomicrobiae bacterium]
MDIARPDLARKRRRKRIFLVVGATATLALVTWGLSRLEPAAPRVPNQWMDTVKRGQMLRQVRGNGTLVPEQIQYVQADMGGQVERIFIQPGAAVTADTVVMELSNPELKQSAFDADWEARTADTQLAKLKVQLESERLALESALATLRADATQARLEADADAILSKDGLVPSITMKKSQARAEDLASRVAIETRRLEFFGESAKAQLAVQEAEGEKLRALRDLRQRQVENLKVRAGIDGVLTQLGDTEVLQSGQRVTPGATLAKVVVPTRLKAEVRVPETQARDVALGQPVTVDTRNGFVPGHVVRVDPAAKNGTVQVDVKLDGPLPRGARPDLSVEGTIELERLDDALHVGRPFQSQPDSTIGLFRMEPDGKHAVRVQVKFGRSSVSTIEVVEGLQVGDKILMGDMSQYDGYDKVRVD